jgi:hypothetical protein
MTHKVIIIPNTHHLYLPTYGRGIKGSAEGNPSIKNSFCPMKN